MQLTTHVWNFDIAFYWAKSWEKWNHSKSILPAAALCRKTFHIASPQSPGSGSHPWVQLPSLDPFLLPVLAPAPLVLPLSLPQGLAPNPKSNSHLRVWFSFPDTSPVPDCGSHPKGTDWAVGLVPVCGFCPHPIIHYHNSPFKLSMETFSKCYCYFIFVGVVISYILFG